MATTDDYSAETGTVAVGGTATGEIETVGDRDRFAVTCKAQRWYRIDAEGYDAGGDALEKPASIVVHSPVGRSTHAATIAPQQCCWPESDVAHWAEVDGREDDTGGSRLAIAEVPDITRPGRPRRARS